MPQRTSLTLLCCVLGLFSFAGRPVFGQKPQLVVQSGHPDWVTAVCFSPDGQMLASGGSVSDATIRLWDVATGIQLRVLRGSRGLVSDVTFSADGRRLAGSSGAEIKVWDVATGTEVNTFTGQPAINQISLSDDGTQLVSGSGYLDGTQTIKIWDVATGTELKSVNGQDLFNPAVNRLSPDQKLLLRPDKNDIKLLDHETHKEGLVLRGHTNEVLAAAWSPDGKTIASGGQDDTVRLWDAATGRELRVLQTTSEVVNAVALSSDGRRLASGSGDSTIGTIKVWDVTSGKGVSTIDAKSRGVGEVYFTAGGQTIIGFNDDGTLGLWDAATGQSLHTLKPPAGTNFGVSDDGKFLFGFQTKDEQTTVSLLDMNTGQEVRKFQGSVAGATYLTCSPDGKILAVSGKQFVQLWNMETGQALRQFTGFPASVRFLAFSPDSKTLASGSVVTGDGQVKLWDVASGKLLRQATLTGTGFIFSLTYNPDGKTIAIGNGVQGHTGTVRLLDATTLTEVRTFTGHADLVRATAFSADGKLLVSGSWDRTIKLWDVATGAELATLIASGANDWLVVTPDGLFDGSPAAWRQILWRFSPQLRDVAPVELFFNEFYYPNLLADIFAGQRPKAAQSIAQRDRRQPQLKLTLADEKATAAPIATRSVPVRIQITNAPAGAQDVRLFRNGSLVKVWPGDVLHGRDSATLEASLIVTAGENQLTAYAFNRDNIKSADAPLSLVGAESLRRKGTAYIMAVGVNQYAPNPFFRNLKFAVADADEFTTEMKSQQERLARYEKVEVVKLTDATATKPNILAALAQLATKAQPEDAVIVYYAGHGLAQGGQFYLIPQDLGSGPTPTNPTAELDALLSAHGISDRELETAFEGVDAGQLTLIIDACNSGQALGGEKDGRGPMNSKGLAQLAYDKGMYILTAAQSFQAAQEVSLVGHGLLTFVLLDEGLKSAAADAEPKDGIVLMREWLDYATNRVPQMQVAKMKTARGLGLDLTFKEDERGLDITRRNGQRPRVFYRRELEAQPMLIALPTAPPFIN